MRMCTVDIKEKACAGKAGGVEMGPAANAHAHCRSVAGWGGALGKGAGSSELPRWHIFLEKGRVGLQRIETWTLWISTESENGVSGVGITALGKVRISLQAEQEIGRLVGSPLDPGLLSFRLSSCQANLRHV